MSRKPDIRELISKARDDDRRMNELLQWYRPYLRLKALGDEQLKLLRPKLDASDIVQTALRKAFQRFDQFEGQEEPQLTAWLNAILKFTIQDAARAFLGPKRDVRIEHPLERAGQESANLQLQLIDADASSVDGAVLRGERALQLASALEKLPKHQAEAIRLRHLEGLTISTIAERMSRSEVSVAGLLRRGMATLRTTIRHALGSSAGK